LDQICKRPIPLCFLSGAAREAYLAQRSLHVHSASEFSKQAHPRIRVDDVFDHLPAPAGLTHSDVNVKKRRAIEWTRRPHPLLATDASISSSIASVAGSLQKPCGQTASFNHLGLLCTTGAPHELELDLQPANEDDQPQAKPEHAV